MDLVSPIVAVGAVAAALIPVGVLVAWAIRAIRRAVHMADLMQRGLAALEGAPATAAEPARPGLVEMVGDIGSDVRRSLHGQQVLATDLGAVRAAQEAMSVRLDEHLAEHNGRAQLPVSLRHRGRPR